MPHRDEVTYWPSRYLPPDDEDHTLYITSWPEQVHRRLGQSEINWKKGEVMKLEHRIEKGTQGAPDITIIEIELGGDDMYKLFKGDMPMLEIKDAGGNVIQQIAVKAKHVGASR